VSDPSLVRAHVFVEGRVQAVGFRYSTYREAIRLAVSGWARNLPDGRVEAVYEGSRDAVEQMLAWTQHGPEHARVTNVTIRDETPVGEEDFSIG